MRLHVRGQILGYKRSKANQHNHTALIKVCALAAEPSSRATEQQQDQLHPPVACRAAEQQWGGDTGWKLQRGSLDAASGDPWCCSSSSSTLPTRNSSSREQGACSRSAVVLIWCMRWLCAITAKITLEIRDSWAGRQPRLFGLGTGKQCRLRGVSREE